MDKVKPIQEYIYLGDRNTDKKYKGKKCRAIINIHSGKCVRGKNGNMLVSFNGTPMVVMARLLRKVKS